MEQPESLLAHILSHPDDPHTGNRANDLLREIFHGYPVESLKTLLLDSREAVVRTGIWMTTELGDRCMPLLDEALPLLWSESKQVRFWAVETLLWAPPEYGANLAKGLELTNDPEPSVRWKATDFAVRASDIQLLSALLWFDSIRTNSIFADGTRLVLNGSSSAPEETLEALKSQNEVMVRFGLISAVRRRRESPDLLEFAGVNPESAAIREFAAEWLRKK